MTLSNTLHKLASPLLYASGAYQRYWRRQAAREPLTLVLVYHRVAADDEADSGRFDIERGTPMAVFEQHVRFLSRHFTPIRPSEVVESAAEPIRFAITFDDGYEDNYSVAASVLRRYGVPAGFYVVSDYVGTDRIFWWEQLAQMFRDTAVASLDLGAVLPAGGSLGPPVEMRDGAGRTAAYERLSAVLRAQPDAAIPAYLGRLSDALAVRPRDQGRDYGLMNWTQLRELAAQGFEIGAHTATHCMLAGVPPETLEKQVQDSVSTIEDALQQPVLTFAYPYGRRHHFDEAAQQAVAAAGCRAAFTTVRGAVRSPVSPYALPRLKFTKPYPFACAYNVQNAVACRSSA